MSSINRYGICILLLFSNVCLAGSAARETLKAMTTEKPGSPYHWVSEDEGGGKILQRVLLGTPGPTVADETVKADVLKRIGTYEEKAGGAAVPVLVEVRQLSPVKGEYNEVWIIARAGTNVAYTVSLSPSPQGGVDFHVSGPWD